MHKNKLTALFFLIFVFVLLSIPVKNVDASSNLKNKECWCTEYIQSVYKLPKIANAKDMGKILTSNGFRKLGSNETPKNGDIVIMQPQIFKDKGFSGAEIKNGHIAIVRSIKTTEKKYWLMTTEQAGKPPSAYGGKVITKSGCTNVQTDVRWSKFSKTDTRYTFYRKK